MFKLLKFVFRVFGLLIIVAILVIVINFVVNSTVNSRVFSQKDMSLIRQSETAVIINEDEPVDNYSTNKLDYAVSLVRHDSVTNIAVYGNAHYVAFAEEHLVEEGIPKENIITDTGELSVYDSIYSIANIYQMNSVIFVDYEDRIKRELYVAEKFDLTASGVANEKMDLSLYERLKEGFLKVRDFAVVNIYKYRPNSLK